MRFPFIGGSYFTRSVNFDAQRCINWYPIKSETGESKNVDGLQGTPGKLLFCDLDPPVTSTANILVLGSNSPENAVLIYDVNADYAPLPFDSTMLQSIITVQLSRDNSLLGVSTEGFDGGQRYTFLFDVATLTEVEDYGDIPVGVATTAMAFSDDFLAVTSGLAPYANTCSIYNLSDYSLEQNIEIDGGTNAYGYSVDFSPDGTLMALGLFSQAAGNVKVYNTDDWTEVTIDTTPFESADCIVYDTKFSYDGEFLAVAAEFATDMKILHIYETMGWTIVASLIDDPGTVDVETFTLAEIAWSPDSTALAIGYNWDYGAQALAGPYETAANLVSSVDFTVTQLFGDYIEDLSDRTYDFIGGAASWSKDGATVTFANYATQSVISFVAATQVQADLLTVTNENIVSMTTTRPT